MKLEHMGGPDSVDPESVDPVDGEWTDRLNAALDEWAEGAATRVALPAPRRTSPWAWAALAASVVGVLSLTQVPWGSPGSDGGPAGVEDPMGSAPGLVLQAADLEVAAPSPFMLVPTRDPSITIVWLLNSPEDPGESS